MLWKTAIGAGTGLLLAWLVLIAVLLWAGRRYERPSLTECCGCCRICSAS